MIITSIKITDMNKNFREQLSRNIRLTEKLNELKRKIRIEKNAKNEAYAFILTSGLLEDYKAFRKNNNEINYQAMDIGVILDDVNKKPDYLMRLGGDN
ncbi:hypothetical protein KL86DYS2_12972 [uncultured Dysgonomonas sp.]|uniref:Uncharacterized protein n=2 Tax=uncultured Dysgonomonas sp. TaxID=206096 RepID=A0A212K3X6_9BACT|nr:hypothetical protein KL86DYS2_12972 [uncultured Dysgonomonas sp.]